MDAGFMYLVTDGRCLKCDIIYLWSQGPKSVNLCRQLWYLIWLGKVVVVAVGDCRMST